MKRPSLAAIELGAVLLAAAGAAYLIWRASQAGAGILSGKNALTKGATNAAGQRVTAYEGAGVLGTMGAAANAASGGYLATFGEWIGLKVYDLTHDTKEVAPEAAARRYQTGGETRDPWPEEQDNSAGELGYLMTGIPSP